MFIRKWGVGPLKRSILFFILIISLLTGCVFYDTQNISLLDTDFQDRILNIGEIESKSFNEYEPSSVLDYKDIKYLEKTYDNTLVVGIPYTYGFLNKIDSTYIGRTYYAARQLEKDLGVDIEIVSGKREEIYEMLMSNEIDLISGAITISKGKDQLTNPTYPFTLSKSYGTQEYSFFSKDFNDESLSLYQLDGKKVGFLLSPKEEEYVNQFNSDRDISYETYFSLDIEDLLESDCQFLYLPSNCTIVSKGYKEIEVLQRDFYVSMSYGVNEEGGQQLVDILNKCINDRKESNLLSYSSDLGKAIYSRGLYFTEEEKEFIELHKKVPLRVDAQSEYYIGSYYDEQMGRFDGQLIVTLDRISDLTGMVYDYNVSKPFSVMQNDIKQGRSDLLVGATESVNTSNTYEYTKSIEDQNIILLGYDKNFNNIAELYKYRVGTISGATINNVIDDEFKNSPLIYFSTYEDMYMALKEGKIDYFIAFEEFYYYFLNFYNDYDLQPAFTFDLSQGKSFIAPKGREGEILVSIINKGLNFVDLNEILNHGYSIGKADTIVFYSSYMYAQALIIILIFLIMFTCYFAFSLKRIRENRIHKEVLDNRLKHAANLTRTFLWSFTENMEYLILTDEIIDQYGVSQEDIIFEDGEQIIDMDLIFTKYTMDSNFQSELDTLKYNLDNEYGASRSGTFKWKTYGDSTNIKYISYTASMDSNKLFNSFFVITRDITHEHLYETSLERQLITDDLTNAKTRNVIFNLTPEFLKGKTIVSFDIDNFGQINDNFSHSEGDRILKIVAERIKLLDNVYEVYRMGGDEFIFIIDYFDESLSRRISNFILKNIKIEGFNFLLEGCFGFYTVEKVQPLEYTLNIAEYAINRAKEMGRNSLFIVDDKIIEDYKRTTELEVQLEKAVENGEIIPFFQPYIDVETKQIVGLEALARWDKDGKILSPFYFLDTAFKIGVITKIDVAIFEKTLKEAKYIMDTYAVPSDFSISTNFAGPSLVKIDPNELLNIANETGVSPSNIAIEVTEQLLINDTAVDKIKELRELGFKISLDDFSAGYSSLNRIKMFDIDILKLDRLLLVDAGLDKTSCEIYKTIVNLGKFLDVVIVSEGVEVQDHENILKDNYVDIAQGYYYSKPLSTEKFIEYLAKSTNKRIK